MTLNKALHFARINATNHYAQQYIRSVDDAIALDCNQGLQVQLMYILNNLQGWRGETARQAKAIMKAFVNRRMEVKQMDEDIVL